MPPLNREKTTAIAVICLLGLAYVGSYVVLSSSGRFEPTIIGLNGVKRYGWAPQGFVTGFKWNRTLMLIYFPLHALDERFWHTFEDSYMGTYPIHEVSTEDIWEVYRAWK